MSLYVQFISFMVHQEVFGDLTWKHPNVFNKLIFNPSVANTPIFIREIDYDDKDISNHTVLRIDLITSLNYLLSIDIAEQWQFYWLLLSSVRREIHEVSYIDEDLREHCYWVPLDSLRRIFSFNRVFTWCRRWFYRNAKHRNHNNSNQTPKN